MSIKQKARKFFASLLAGFLAQTDSPGTPEGKKLDFAQECLKDGTVPVSEAIRYRKRATVAEVQLEAAEDVNETLKAKLEVVKEAFRKIDCTAEGMDLDPNEKIEAMQKLAVDAWRAATT